MSIVPLHTVGQTANVKPRVFQKERGPKTGLWTWECKDWVGDHFTTETEAATDMQRIRDREGI
jgi:hypothetical protein